MAYNEGTITWEYFYKMQDSLIGLTDRMARAFSKALCIRCKKSEEQIILAADLACELARRTGMDEGHLKGVYYGVLLHDIGELKIADELLTKNERTDEEDKELQRHTVEGYYVLKSIKGLSEPAIAARWHHERYDGGGYPDGLSGKNIPLVARITRLAEDYSEIVCSGSSPQDTLEQLEIGIGRIYDPELLAVLKAIIDDGLDFTPQNKESEKIILVIDDDPMILKQVEFIIKKEPLYRFEGVTSGEAGIERLHTGKADLVLLDMEMPDMNGLETLKEIRRMRKNVKVAFMTGESDMDFIQQAEELGASDYLAKPLAPKALLDSINKLLNR